MFDAIFQLIGDVASAITDFICGFISKRFNLTTSGFLNLFIKILVYIIIFIPIFLGVLYGLLQLIVYLF